MMKFYPSLLPGIFAVFFSISCGDPADKHNISNTEAKSDTADYVDTSYNHEPDYSSRKEDPAAEYLVELDYLKQDTFFPESDIEGAGIFQLVIP